MSGLYIHIPFCRQACHYCNFHFSTNLKVQEEMIQSICKEIELRRDYLTTNVLKTIYFGGGTPSLLTEKQIERIFETIYKYYSTEDSVEITLEANPDDLNKKNISVLKKHFNRLSIGIQSFSDKNLQFMNRLHSAQEAEKSVKEAQESGITNISIDLIYGVPGSKIDIWIKDLEKAIALKVPHLSCYGFTIEQGTVFGNWQKKGKIKPVCDEETSEQFALMTKTLSYAGYEHYEISNFALPGMYSKHNTSYWDEVPYLGVGPGAHSYNYSSRQFNIQNNHKYIQEIRYGKIPFEEEKLTEIDKMNEYILTRLRTMWGIDYVKLLKLGYNKNNLDKILSEYISKEYVDASEGRIRLLEKGKLIADKITLDLIII